MMSNQGSVTHVMLFYLVMCEKLATINGHWGHT